jgi:stage II sporulation protein GA (sporulation sigma-E factor processing peptidase)
VELDGKTASLRGMVDSGNLLRDPMSGRTVICAEAAALREIISPPLAAVMGGISPDSVDLPSADARRVRVIPTETATGAGMLYGFLPDRLILADGKEEREVDAIVAFASVPTDGVDALIPSELLF